MNGYVLIAVVGLLIAGALAWALVTHLRLFRYYHYVCVKCSTSYKPSTFPQSLLAVNFGEQRKLKCPHCGTREWAYVARDTLKRPPDDG
jgi:DNA-directed RNA polymerase subunit RPC12/RpoP